jgi:rubrerythrin
MIVAFINYREINNQHERKRNMDFLELAMAIEKEGIDYYTKLADKVKWKDEAGIFLFLAREEKGHYEILNAWQKHFDVPPLENFNILKESKAVFRRLSDHFETYGTPATDYYNAYEKALRLEEKSVAFYKEALIKMESPAQKEVLTKIIEQEKSHVNFLTDMLGFLRHPGEWLENAEWYHLEEY